MKKQRINLYLDDRRDCPEGFVIARNMEEALFYLENENYEVEILSLDHDLGENKETKELLPTGYDFVKYFCEYGLYAKRIYIHTDNPPGREAMYKTLLSSQRRGFIKDDIKIYHYSITENKYTDPNE